MRNQSLQIATIKILTCCFAVCLCAVSGCHDGPLYALKHVNPYFTMKEWREDDAWGVTDHERRNQLQQLSDQIAGMDATRQAFWAGHLNKMIENDPSPEMRRLAVLAAGRMTIPAGLPIAQRGLKDDSTKVKMEACRALGVRREPQAAQLLAEVAGKSTDQDVQQSAIAALGKHKNGVAMNSLRLALNDRNPATRTLAMGSLKNVTGRDFGSTPESWLRGLGKPGAVPNLDAAPQQNGSAVQIASGVEQSEADAVSPVRYR